MSQTMRLLSQRTTLLTRSIGRSFSSGTNKTVTPTITLFQYAICPFCNINKALLAYSNTPYSITEVNPLTKAELKFSPEYRKVPIAMIDEKQINGSKEINEALLDLNFVKQNISQKNDLPMEIFANSDNAKQWQDFARDDLAPILYPNICRSLGESYQAFGYVDGVGEFSGMQKALIRSIGSFAMYFAASKIKSKRNITDEREALNKCLDRWEESGLDKGSREFGSGLESPDLGDISMYGVMNSVSGMEAHEEVVLGRGGAVVDWYLRMQEETSTAR